MKPTNNTQPEQPDAQQPADEELDDAICSAWPRPWRAWKGRPYQKIEYDVLLPSGEIVPNCWPNAGKINACDNTGRSWENGVMYRRAANPLMGEIPERFRKPNAKHIHPEPTPKDNANQ
jgi:hypothetical protein